ncbi:hypothetical protein IMZ08_21650 [Bacillus luteolus]|uniref:Uncharacterized protein n=1 Tax=Litchfieldia luteola TaxID=682179 RepID=A0ABR9QR32_9BACI|nr:hypothetical protein [Cytobacillus luteolus]MBE4910649.1 hypothetical protein [Cytobacillus luteolus]MBP1943828.1 hypothetical protein [Cytobacillus luteolus]
MIKVKVKTDKNHSFTIPVPLAVLHASSSILSSEWIWRKVTRQINLHTKHNLNLDHPKFLKAHLKQMIKELRHHKGLVLVDIKLKDGTSVLIRL